MPAPRAPARRQHRAQGARRSLRVRAESSEDNAIVPAELSLVTSLPGSLLTPLINSRDCGVLVRLTVLRKFACMVTCMCEDDQHPRCIGGNVIPGELLVSRPDFPGNRVRRRR